MGAFDVDYNKITERTEFPYEIEVTHHTWIEMTDGVRLSAKIWQPKKSGTTKGAVLEYLPYRNDEFTALRDEIRHKYFAGFGYKIGRATSELQSRFDLVCRLLLV